jgi:nicotinate-nucleotide pyrophosphorylase (carboxylating)
MDASFTSEDLRQIDALIDLALFEDIRSGDVTTEAVYWEDEITRATFVAKQSGIIAGLGIAQKVAETLYPDFKINWEVTDGDMVRNKQTIGTIEGPAGVILTAERTMLNFMQRMSGIATTVRELTDLISHTKAIILDTRKTVPGNRITDKWAVVIGGGHNHRMGLYDRYLIKENHIRVAGSVENAIQLCMVHRAGIQQGNLEIEVEVTNLDEFEKALTFPEVDYIMLDNMSNEDMKKAVSLNNGTVKLEASGNVSAQTIRSIAECGVDFISMGSITHSVSALDISLLFDS